MAKLPSLSIQVHVDDDTKFETNRVPSAQQDFVSIKLGWQVSVLLFNSAQAKALAQAVMDAHKILKTIEIDVEQAEMAKVWSGYEGYGYEGEDVYDCEDDDEYVECTIENPCGLCQNSY